MKKINKQLASTIISVFIMLGFLFTLLFHLNYKHKIELQLLENNLYTETLEDYLNYEIDLMGLQLEIALLEQEIKFLKKEENNYIQIELLEQQIELLQQYIEFILNK